MTTDIQNGFVEHFFSKEENLYMTYPENGIDETSPFPYPKDSDDYNELNHSLIDIAERNKK